MSSSSSKSNKRSYAKSNEKNIDEKEIENILLNKKKKRSKKQYIFSSMMTSPFLDLRKRKTKEKRKERK